MNTRLCFSNRNYFHHPFSGGPEGWTFLSAVSKCPAPSIDNSFNQNLTGWNNGDFNHDRKINGDDYTLIDNAFNTQNGVSLAATVASPQLQISKALTTHQLFAIANTQPMSPSDFDPFHRRKSSLANEIFAN